MENLPEYVIVCPVCDGKGETTQTYTAGCGQGYYKSKGPCELCGKGEHYKGSGYVYRASLEGVPKSVVEQIERAKAAQGASE